MAARTLWNCFASAAVTNNCRELSVNIERYDLRLLPELHGPEVARYRTEAGCLANAAALGLSLTPLLATERPS
jgi:hypothetical protein